jgi:hypothetical protein
MSHLAVRVVRSLSALVLSLWIAAAGCMLGCQNMVASAATGDAAPTHEQNLAAIVSGDACAAGGSHDCCASKKVAANKAPAPTASAKPSLQTALLVSQTESLSPKSSGRMKDCPLALGRAVAVSKLNGNENVAAPVAVSLKALLVEPLNEGHASLSPRARLPNRGHTYLRCCVFLI